MFGMFLFFNDNDFRKIENIDPSKSVALEFLSFALEFMVLKGIRVYFLGMISK